MKVRMKIKINAPFQSHTRVTDCPGSPPVIRVLNKTRSTSVELPIYVNKSIKRIAPFSLSNSAHTLRSAASTAGTYSSSGRAVGSDSGAETGLSPRRPHPRAANRATAAWLETSTDAGYGYIGRRRLAFSVWVAIGYLSTVRVWMDSVEHYSPASSRSRVAFSTSPHHGSTLDSSFRGFSGSL